MTTLQRYTAHHAAIRDVYRGYPWWSGLWDVVLTLAGSGMFLLVRELFR